MGTGALTSHIDVAQLVLYAFWLFFFVLVFWLHREGKREGWPLEVDAGNGKIKNEGFPRMPAPKEFILPNGQGSRFAPSVNPPEYEVKATPIARNPGAALHPTGDPQIDGVGPAAWAIRRQVPDMTWDGRPKIVPLRVATDHGIESRDPDPRGMAVVGCDGKQGGTVVDCWVDRSEPNLRYLELETTGGRRVLLPMTLAKLKSGVGVKVASIRGDQFANVPGLANPDQVTLQEEDQITAYYGGGTLYATPDRSEPWL